MNKLYLIVIVFILIAVPLFGQNYGLDNTDPGIFGKYTLPATKVQSLNLGGSFSFMRNNIIIQQSPVDQFSRLSSYSFGLNPSYTLINESDDDYLSIFTKFSGGYSTSKENQNNTEIKNKSSVLNFQFSNTTRKYISGSNLFYNDDIDLEIIGNDQNKSTSYNDKKSISYSSFNRQQRYRFSIGFGYGKIRNVTPLVEAARIQERLKYLNVIDNNFDDETMLDLAKAFSRADYFSIAHNRPEKYFWESIGDVLEQHNIPVNNLNQYANSYLREVLNEVRFYRREGILVYLNFALDYYNYFSKNQIPSSNLVEEFDAKIKFGLSGSKQLGLNSQIWADFTAAGGPNVLKSPSLRQEYNFLLKVGYDYELTDRLVFSVNNQAYYLIQNVHGKYKRFENHASAVFTYFVEDFTSINLSYNWSLKQTPAGEDFYAGSSSSNHQVSLGFTYYLFRGIQF